MNWYGKVEPPLPWFAEILAALGMFLGIVFAGYIAYGGTFEGRFIQSRPNWPLGSAYFMMIGTPFIFYWIAWWWGGSNLWVAAQVAVSGWFLLGIFVYIPPIFPIPASFVILTSPVMYMRGANLMMIPMATFIFIVFVGAAMRSVSLFISRDHYSIIAIWFAAMGLLLLVFILTRQLRWRDQTRYLPD